VKPVELELTRHAPAVLARARAVWPQRYLSEYRSVQVMSRFLTEVTGAAEPVDVCSRAAELVDDERRHVELCAAMCEALGVPVSLPDPVALPDPPAFLAAPMADRAIATAVSMLAVCETLSTAFITDLRDRCSEPSVRAVLEATIADEAGHQDFGWNYVKRAMKRYPPGAARDLQHLVRSTLAPFREQARRHLEGLKPEQRTLDAWPEPELVALGLHSDVRLALVFERAEREQLQPKLAQLGLQSAPG
jgi:hypothetical protein